MLDSEEKVSPYPDSCAGCCQQGLCHQCLRGGSVQASVLNNGILQDVLLCATHYTWATANPWREWKGGNQIFSPLVVMSARLDPMVAMNPDLPASVKASSIYRQEMFAGLRG